MAAKTMSDIEAFFDACVNFWITRCGCSKDVATVRAIWWDCVEAWNIDRSWDENRISFINRFRKYNPYDPIPEESLVESGNA